MSLEPIAKLLQREVHPDLAQLWKGPPVSKVVESDAVQAALSERDDWWLTQRWLSSKEAAHALRELRAVKVFPKALVPIATDEAGNYTCHDAATGKLVDWDHETRAPRKLRGTLPSVLAELNALQRAELAAAKKPLPAAAPSGELPRRAKQETVAFLRKLISPMGKYGSADVAALTPDADLVIAVGNRTVYPGSLKKRAEVVPAEPTLAKQKKQMGFISMKAHSLVAGPDGAVLVRADPELQLWQWAAGSLALKACGRWAARDLSFQSARPRLTATRFAVSAEKDGSRMIAVWERARLPAAASLEGDAATTKPTVSVTLPRDEDAVFDLGASGELVVAQALGYPECELTRWDAKGKLLAKVKLDQGVADLRLIDDGSSLAVTSDGELRWFDERLKERRKIVAHPRMRANSVTASPSGRFFVTTAAGSGTGELAVWSAHDLQLISRVKVKATSHDFSVHALTDGFALTVGPFALFSFS